MSGSGGLFRSRTPPPLSGRRTHGSACEYSRALFQEGVERPCWRRSGSCQEPLHSFRQRCERVLAAYAVSKRLLLRELFIDGRRLKVKLMGARAVSIPIYNSLRAGVVSTTRSAPGLSSGNTEPDTPVAARYVRYPFKVALPSAERVTVETRMDACSAQCLPSFRQFVRHRVPCRAVWTSSGRRVADGARLGLGLTDFNGVGPYGAVEAGSSNALYPSAKFKSRGNE